MAAEPGDPIVASHFQELRRGTVVLACLLVLDEPRYGYALLRTLGDAGLDVEANTLYPLLRRLEKQGFLTSEWDTAEARPSKFYRTSEAGVRLASTLTTEWIALTGAITSLTDDPTTAEEH